MIDIAILRALAAAGAPVEAILDAIELDQRAEIARVQARRLAGAERQRRHRDAMSPLHDVTQRDGCDTSASLTSSLSSSNTSEILEEKKEKKVRAVPARKTALRDEWGPNEAHFAKAARPYVLQKADDMRNWAKSKGIMRADWDATFHGFLRPRESKPGMILHGTDRDSGKSEFKQALRALGDFAQGPEGSGGGEAPLRLLPAARRGE